MLQLVAISSAEDLSSHACHWFGVSDAFTRHSMVLIPGYRKLLATITNARWSDYLRNPAHMNVTKLNRRTVSNRAYLVTGDDIMEQCKKQLFFMAGIVTRSAVVNPVPVDSSQGQAQHFKFIDIAHDFCQVHRAASNIALAFGSSEPLTTIKNLGREPPMTGTRYRTMQNNVSSKTLLISFISRAEAQATIVGSQSQSSKPKSSIPNVTYAPVPTSTRGVGKKRDENSVDGMYYTRDFILQRMLHVRGNGNAPPAYEDGTCLPLHLHCMLISCVVPVLDGSHLFQGRNRWTETVPFDLHTAELDCPAFEGEIPEGALVGVYYTASLWSLAVTDTPSSSPWNSSFNLFGIIVLALPQGHLSHPPNFYMDPDFDAKSQTALLESSTRSSFSPSKSSSSSTPRASSSKSPRKFRSRAV